MKHPSSFKLLLNIALLTSLTASPLFTYAEVLEDNASIAEEPQEVIVKYEHTEEITVIDVPEETSIEEVIAAIEENPNVEYAEPNFSRSLFSIPTNDVHGDNQWALNKIDAPGAWDISTSTEILVAIIDTGVDYTHPDLVNMMWEGSSCVDESGDSISGGCMHGYDFVENDSDPMVDSGTLGFHGTHVAGIMGAEWNNNIGIAGIAPNVKIMSLKIFDGSGAGTVDDEIRAINFAIRNGAKIINASYGGEGESDLEKAAIEDFQNAGGIFIAAAGNESRNNDGGTHNYPSDHDLESIISVAATNEDDNLSSFSNWGNIAVDLGAPGENIFSTYSATTSGALTQSYVYASGTSMATPMVAGVAALLWGTNLSLTSAQVKNILVNSGDALSSLSSKTVSGKRLNAYNALSTNTTVPTAVLSNLPSSVDVSAIPSLNVSVSGTSTTQYKYKLDDGSWSSATPIATHITASSLLNATHTISVIAGNAWGLWQPEASPTDYTWVVEDSTAPEITGLADDSSGTTEKTWNWSSSDSSATFRFEVSASGTPSTLTDSSYSSVTTTSADSPVGTIYLHVQAKDNNGNTSATTTVSAVLTAPPAPPAQSGGGGGRGGGGGGGGGGNTATAIVTKAGDINGDSRVDLLDFNNLMVTWSSRTSAFVDFNNLMINWTL